MKILLAGAAGQLGNELFPLFADSDDVVAADLNPAASRAPGCLKVELGDRDALLDLLADVQPDLVLNAAAYTAVDRAEGDAETAHRVNAELPGWLAQWAARHGCGLVHYSTDYIFDGRSSRPYLESDRPAPLNVYGASKLAGEQAIRDAGCQALILRTSWVYSSHGHNFVLSMLNLAQRVPELRIVDDQVGCPTWARNLARVTRQALDRGLLQREGCRVFNYSDQGAVSWFDFAGLVFRFGVELGLLEHEPKFSRTDTAGYPQPATRPAYSVLDTTAIRAAAGFEPPGLHQSLRACMKEIANHD